MTKSLFSINLILLSIIFITLLNLHDCRTDIRSEAFNLKENSGYVPVEESQREKSLKMRQTREGLSRKSAWDISNLSEQDDVDDTEEDADALDDNGRVPDYKRSDKKYSLKGPKIWDHWGKWSPCSVSCGVGKITRWRHCVSGGCASGEKEAQIKTCTLPAC